MGLVGSALRDLRSLISRRRPQVPTTEVREGMSFARLLTGGVTETVRVAEITTDRAGNPHIRFAVKVRDQYGVHDEGTRVLALGAFLQQYRRVR